MSEPSAVALVDPAAGSLWESRALALDKFERTLAKQLLQERGPASTARALATEFEVSAARSLDSLRHFGPALGVVIVAGLVLVAVLGMLALQLGIVGLASAL